MWRCRSLVSGAELVLKSKHDLDDDGVRPTDYVGCFGVARVGGEAGTGGMMNKVAAMMCTCFAAELPRPGRDALLCLETCRPMTLRDLVPDPLRVEAQSGSIVVNPFEASSGGGAWFPDR